MLLLKKYEVIYNFNVKMFLLRILDLSYISFYFSQMLLKLAEAPICKYTRFLITFTVFNQ